MPKKHKPRSGSLQFWPRKRSKRPYARIRAWSNKQENKLLGFAGYKAGMTHVMLKDSNPKSVNKDTLINYPATILECPPLKPISLRFYKNSRNGLQLSGEMFSKSFDKNLTRKIKPPKKKSFKQPESFDILRLVVHTQPSLIGLKKKPEIFELQISNKDVNFANSLLEKEIKLSDVFRDLQFLDIHAVTKGKGYQGAVKRFGIKIRQHKSEKTKRGVGNLGPWTPKKVSWRVPQAGQTGYQLRTEYNKLSLKISSDPKEINPKGGFPNYGLIKLDYILIKGSIPGSRKRLILMTEPLRQKIKEPQLKLQSVSLASKQ